MSNLQDKLLLANPTLKLLAKLGSIAVHADEFISPAGHPFDRDVLAALLSDGEVKEFLAALDKMALLPKKRGKQQEEGE